MSVTAMSWDDDKLLPRLRLRKFTEVDIAWILKQHGKPMVVYLPKSNGKDCISFYASVV
jgi:hypothetical protein